MDREVAVIDDDAPIVQLAEVERREIDRALKRCAGSVDKAAKLLGIGRATLYRRLAGQKNAGASQ